VTDNIVKFRRGTPQEELRELSEDATITGFVVVLTRADEGRPFEYIIEGVTESELLYIEKIISGSVNKMVMAGFVD